MTARCPARPAMAVWAGAKIKDEGHRDVHVDQAVGIELGEEEAVADGLGEDERGHDGSHEQKGEEDARPFPGPQVDDASQAYGQGHPFR